MPVDNRRSDDGPDAGKFDVHEDLEARVLKDAPAAEAGAGDGKPGRSIIEGALAARDTHLLRAIASERKGLTDEQRQALLLVADILDHASR